MKLLVNITRFIMQKYSTFRHRTLLKTLNTTIEEQTNKYKDIYSKLNEKIEKQVLLRISNDSDDFDTTIEHYIQVK